LSEFGGYLFQCFGDCFGHCVGGAVGYRGEEGVAGGAFGEGYYCGAVVGSFQEVAFPMAWEATGETSWSFSDVSDVTQLVAFGLFTPVAGTPAAALAW